MKKRENEEESGWLRNRIGTHCFYILLINVPFIDVYNYIQQI